MCVCMYDVRTYVCVCMYVFMYVRMYVYASVCSVFIVFAYMLVKVSTEQWWSHTERGKSEYLGRNMSVRKSHMNKPAYQGRASGKVLRLVPKPQEAAREPTAACSARYRSCALVTQSFWHADTSAVNICQLAGFCIQ